MKRLLARLVSLILPLLAVSAAAYGIASLPRELYVDRAATAQVEEVAHDPRGFAVDLAETLPDSGITSEFIRDLDAWLTDHPQPEPEPPAVWSWRQLLAQASLSYLLCLSALVISGFVVFLLFCYLVLPAARWRKSLLTIGFLVLTGIPAALLAWRPLAPLFHALEPPLMGTLASLFGLEGTAEMRDFVRAELAVLAALLLGDGLAGILLLRAQALTTSDHFSALVASHWSSLQLKDFSLPVPGTLSLAIAREMRALVFPAWSGLLGRFLVTEIILELVLHLLTDLDPQGIGFYLFELLVRGAPPEAFAATAAVLVLPLLIQPTTGTLRELERA